MESVVWDSFSSRPNELQRASDAIRTLVSSDRIMLSTETSPDDEEGEEGQVLTRYHRYRERRAGLVKRKKERALSKRHSLNCEVCGFDFGLVYGDRGYGFMECHHTRPLSELSHEGERIKLSDLALVCSNCHRMIHKNRPWLSIDELRELTKR